ncbi:KAP family P-loop NTPase fold protein [Aeromonas veronii]|uniref:KAP family P-loop NTPase fold protein n=1 Tax=Aeromonas veronii TaxID=654 RepID=UPI000DE5B9EA|nr:P-loop NTPase fold protein [Aeromonas veronii]
MRLITPSLIVEDCDGFENDVLQRKFFGEALSNLVIRTTDELVISIDGKWGEGKTTFVKMWQGHLKDNGVPSIYIDAFQNDYTDDAFISIAGAITTYVAKNSSEDKTRVSFSDKAKKVGVRLFSWSAKIGIKAATLGVVKEADISELSEIGNDIATNASDAVSKLIEERLSSYEKEHDIIQSFKDSLSEIPSSLKGNNSGRLVIIIDELDRCRPSFAVEVLEKIKHLFSVKNITFVLVMHKSQLEEAIKSVYGRDIDAHTYLQKFISIETTIPKRIIERHNNDFNSYITHLLSVHELETWGDDNLIRDCVCSLGRHLNLSLRQLEKVFTNIAIIYSTSGKNHLRLVPIITFISTLKVAKPNIFKRVFSGKISYAELSRELELTHLGENNEHERNLTWIMDWVRFSILTDEEYKMINEHDNIKHFSQSLWQYNINREGLLPIFCNKLCLFKAN